MQKFMEKYTPKTLDEMISNKKAISVIRYWAKEHKKPLFIYGATGVGKTLSAKLIAKEMGWSLYHTDASDIRNKESMRNLINVACTSNTLFSKTRLILIDEVDGIADKRGKGDYGSFSELLKIINISLQPIILIANDPYINKKVRPIFEKSEKVKFDLPNKLSVLKFAKDICEKENIEYDLVALRTLVEKIKNDIRALLLDLHTLKLNEKITVEDLNSLGDRKKDIDIFKVLQQIFYSKNFYETRKVIDKMTINWELLFAWLEENIPRQYKDPKNLNNGLEALSRADIFKGRIKGKNWILLKYVLNYLTIGVAYSKENIENRDYRPFIYPSVIQKLGRSKKSRNTMKSVVNKIREKIHCSKHIIRRNYIPFFNIIANNNKYTKELISKFNFDFDELKAIGVKITPKQYEKLTV